MRGWIEWIVKGLWKRRKPILTVVAIGTVITAFGIFRSLDFSSRPPRTITDESFISAANVICAKKIPPLRAVRREDETESNLEKQTANIIERVAPKLRAIVEEPAGIDVAAADQSEVTAWFADFDDYVDAGLRYAAAIRKGDPAVYNAVDDEAVAPLKAISDFARANHIDNCIP